MAASGSSETLQQTSNACQADDWATLMRQGHQLTSAGRYLDAMAWFRSAATIRPGDLQTLAALGATSLRAGLPEASLDVFNHILRMDPVHGAAWHGKGVSLSHLGEREAALTAFRDAVRHDPTAWASWRSIADLTTNEDERLQAVQASAEALSHLCRSPAASPHLHLKCADALVHAHRFQEATDFIVKTWSRFPDESIAYDRLARTRYRLGDFRNAFAFMTGALDRIPPDEIPASPATAPFTQDGALRALCEIGEVLEAHALAFFLAGGTLLGFVRNGGPLGQDRDVDIGIFAEQPGIPDIAGILRTHPAILLPPSASPGDRYFAVRCQGIAVDIFLHDRKQGAVSFGFSHTPGDIQWRLAPFGLTSASFHGRNWMLPDPAGQYLSGLYGVTWQSPDPGFASVISSPALFAVNPYARAYYSAARARKYRMTGHHAKANALLAQSPISLGADLCWQTSPEDREARNP
tara:strand:- start:24654 stop:26051 length:1398 start_codon:yes stop_codon:yes gene_type:complete